eukprot:2383929-Rhodomonas_salina.1
MVVLIKGYGGTDRRVQSHSAARMAVLSSAYGGTKQRVWRYQAVLDPTEASVASASAFSGSFEHE